MDLNMNDLCENGPITKAPSKVLKLMNSKQNKQASSDDEPMDIMQNDEPNELNTNNNNIKSKPKTKRRSTSRTTKRRRRDNNSNNNNNNNKKSKSRQRTPPNTNSNQRQYRSWSTFQHSPYSITIHNNMTKKQAKKLMNTSFDSKTNLKHLCDIYNTYVKTDGKKEGYEHIKWSKITVNDMITIAETVLCMYCGNDSKHFCTKGCSTCQGWVHETCVVDNDLCEHEIEHLDWNNYICNNCTASI